ncbi:MAG: hypothetical protein F4105_16025 [Gemmatimonadetes bacterium]|nr:hypothetical protein [Gemmatimonadota bacterium]
MKLPQSFNFVPLLVVVLLVQDSRAEDTLREHTDWVLSVAFSPDGTTLASGAADGTVKLWDVEKRKEIDTLKKGDWGFIYSSVAFSPDGRLLAAGAGDTVKLWNVFEDLSR